MKPLKVNPKFRSNVWQPKGKVWYLHNDDNEMQEKEKKAKEKLESIKSRVAKDNYIRKMIKEGIYL